MAQAGMGALNLNSGNRELIQTWSKCDFSDEPH